MLSRVVLFQYAARRTEDEGVLAAQGYVRIMGRGWRNRRTAFPGPVATSPSSGGGVGSSQAHAA